MRSAPSGGRNRSTVSSIGGREIVGGEAEGTAEPAEAAPECQASDAGCRVDAERCRQSVFLRFPVEIGQRTAGLDAGGVRGGIDGDLLHERQVDDDATVAQSMARDVVTAMEPRARAFRRVSTGFAVLLLAANGALVPFVKTPSDGEPVCRCRFVARIASPRIRTQR